MLVMAIGERMEQVALRLHPDKTRIVYCQDGRRRSSFEHTAFDFLALGFHHEFRELDRLQEESTFELEG